MPWHFIHHRPLQPVVMRSCSLRLLQARRHAFLGHLQHLLDVSELSARKVVEVHQAMLKLLVVRSLFDGKPDFLQSDPAMIVTAQNIDTCSLKSAKQTPLPHGFVVSALPIVRPVP
jgi:hypothetical protein